MIQITGWNVNIVYAKIISIVYSGYNIRAGQRKGWEKRVEVRGEWGEVGGGGGGGAGWKFGGRSSSMRIQRLR